MTAVPGTGAKFYVDGKEFIATEPLQFDDNDVALDMAEERGMDVSLLRTLLRLHREGRSIIRASGVFASGECRVIETRRLLENFERSDGFNSRRPIRTEIDITLGNVEQVDL